jgi:FkbM family methyltransferase
MSIQWQIHQIVKRLTGIRVFHPPPRGTDLFSDLGNCLPRCPIEVVFDVGANVGQSAKRFLARFPRAEVYCFEPVAETFHRLQTHFKNDPRVHCVPLALGAAKGSGEIVLEGTPDLFFLKKSPTDGSPGRPARTQSVEIDALDAFCTARSVPRIDYLKIDAEGSDLDVLRGADTMLVQQKIALVEVEAGMNRRNQRHVPIEALKEFLESKRYFLFGIYEQVPEWRTEEPHLRRANLLFISERAIQANKSG